MEENPSEQDLGSCSFVHHSASAQEDLAPGWINQSAFRALAISLAGKQLPLLDIPHLCCRFFSLLLPFSIAKETQGNVTLPCASCVSGCQCNPGQDGLIWTDWQGPVLGCESQQYFSERALLLFICCLLINCQEWVLGFQNKAPAVVFLKKKKSL